MLISLIKMITAHFRGYSPEDVVRSVELRFGFDLEAIRGPLRGKEVARARRALIDDLNAYTDLSAAEIADYVNRSTQYVYFVLSS